VLGPAQIPMYVRTFVLGDKPTMDAFDPLSMDLADTGRDKVRGEGCAGGRAVCAGWQVRPRVAGMVNLNL
jgi:hypothetical protein